VAEGISTLLELRETTWGGDVIEERDRVVGVCTGIITITVHFKLKFKVQTMGYGTIEAIAGVCGKPYNGSEQRWESWNTISWV
jgi:hypothetical protein